MVGYGRNGNADGIDRADKFPVIGHGRTAICSCCFLRPIHADVGYSYNFTVRYFMVFLQVVITQMADTHHADFHGVHYLQMPLSDFSIKSINCLISGKSSTSFLTFSMATFNSSEDLNTI